MIPARTLGSVITDSALRYPNGDRIGATRRGENVYSPEVEDAVSRLAGGSYALISPPGKKWGQTVCSDCRNQSPDKATHNQINELLFYPL